jgi:diguanylate cyclase (GGDEF)-like protein/PAS domain S-box-containing protein
MVQLESCNAVLVCAMDLTIHAQAEAQLRESEQNFRRLFESMTDVYYRTDSLGVVQMVGPGVRRVLGYEPHEIIGRTAEAYYPSPADRDALKRAIMEHGEVTDFSGQMVRKDGRIIDISISSHIFHDEHNNFAGVEGIYRDVTDRKTLERELRLLASTDSLTGVANRRAFFEQAEKIFNGCNRYQETMAILMLDLDHFKLINDRHGHAIGDNVLIRFAETVEGELRDTDCIGRLGGEEFCITLRQVTYDEASNVSKRILDQVRALVLESNSGETFGVTVCIGLALHKSTDKELKHLLDRADKALYEAKYSGRDRVICAT